MKGKFIFAIVVIPFLLTTCLNFGKNWNAEVKRMGITVEDNSFCFSAEIINKKRGDPSSANGYVIYRYVPATNGKKNYSTDKELLVLSSGCKPMSPEEIETQKITSIKIGFERNEKIYTIKKIDDTPIADIDVKETQIFEYAEQHATVLGTGYFEDDAEYVLVFFHHWNHHYKLPSMPPVRFSIINGIPLIWLGRD